MYRHFTVIALALVFTALIGYADFVTGQELVLTIFYLIPVVLTIWYSGRAAGIMIAILNSVVWYYAQIKSGAVRSHPAYLYWETVVLLGFLLIVALLLNSFKELLAKESSMARTDYLTGLANRRYFFEAVDGEISRSSRMESPFTITYIDADNFKNVNDTLGHHAGDRVLISISKVLKAHTRKMDVVARLGGDEFAVLLPSAGSQDVQAVIGKMKQALFDEMHRDGFPVTFSIGAVVFKQFPGTADNAVKMADSLMYEVKKEGKNSVKLSVF
jgi:diguanylate cyclase (GGDEF)-like protein